MAVTFLATLTAGILGVLAIAPLAHIAVRYLRTVSTLTIALAVATAVWAWLGRDSQATPLWTFALCAVAVIAGGGLLATSATAPTRAGPFRAAAAIGFVTSLVFAMLWGAACGLWPTGNVLAIGAAVVGQTIGAVVLGSVTVSWLLGHAYLTATGMPIDPLRTLSNVFLWATVVRAGWVALIAAIIFLNAGGPPFASALQHVKSEWLIGSMRICVGLVLLVAFAVMVRDCVRVRNTQSATGILYFASVAAYVGELSNQYLVRQIGIGF